MASGHEYRTRRPNTWLLRPTPQVKILLANPEPSTHGPSSSLAQRREARGRAEVVSFRGTAAFDHSRILNACHVGPKCDIDRRGPSHPAQRMMVISSIWIGMGISVAESGAANR
jgi:hypothetical protein